MTAPVVNVMFVRVLGSTPSLRGQMAGVARRTLTDLARYVERQMDVHGPHSLQALDACQEFHRVAQELRDWTPSHPALPENSPGGLL